MSDRQLLSVQVHPSSLERLDKLALKISKSMGTKMTRSDVARMALAKGVVALEREHP